jgi:diaminopimelate epimerase
MKYFNANGNEGSMCGNGGRSAAQFVHDNNLTGNKMAFLAYDGVHKAEILADGVLLEMLDINVIHKRDNHFFIDSGSPHYVTFVDNLDRYKVYEEGRKIRYSYREEGTNVNFIEEKGDAFHIRTYERGVENETLACGTGVTAAAVAIAERSSTALNEIHLKARGGNLTVYLEKSEKGYTNIWLKGPAEKVFEGAIKF